MWLLERQFQRKTPGSSEYQLPMLRLDSCFFARFRDRECSNAIQRGTVDAGNNGDRENASNRAETRELLRAKQLSPLNEPGFL